MWVAATLLLFKLSCPLVHRSTCRAVSSAPRRPLITPYQYPPLLHPAPAFSLLQLWGPYLYQAFECHRVMPGCFPVSLGSQVPSPCYPHPKTCPFRAPSTIVLSWLLSLSLLVVESQDHCLPIRLLLLSEGVCLPSRFPLPHWFTFCQPFSLSPTPHSPTPTPPPAQ